MQMEEARGFLMQALRQPHWTEVEGLLMAVGDLKAKAGPQRQQLPLPRGADGRSHLEKGESALISEIIWTFIIQGILVPGRDDSNRNLPFLRLTDYGRRCMEENKILPHDPDGYLKEFERAVPSADPTIVEYLTEALQCFIHGLNRSAAIMLGGASEKGILLLIDSYAASIADPNKKTTIENQISKASSIFRKYKIFEKEFPALKQKLPQDLSDNVDTLLSGVFSLIRSSRNESGHPASGVSVDRDTNYSHLKLFVPYCQRICGLIGWFQNNPT